MHAVCFIIKTECAFGAAARAAIFAGVQPSRLTLRGLPLSGGVAPGYSQYSLPGWIVLLANGLPCRVLCRVSVQALCGVLCRILCRVSVQALCGVLCRVLCRVPPSLPLFVSLTFRLFVSLTLSLLVSLSLSLFVSSSLLPLSPVQQKYLSLEGYTVSNPGQRPGIVGGKERIAWRAIRPRRWRR